VLAQDPRIVPVIGARKRAQLEESLGALELRLSASELEQIARAVPASEVAGTRYDPHQVKALDSER
jgi:aryl-alcohol dehydrogenase-like predicted oxidoreductase